MTISPPLATGTIHAFALAADGGCYSARDSGLWRSADGGVSFYGSPKGAAPVEFKASAANATSITFTNAGHDYPQRVSYKLTADGLDAEVSLADGSKPNRWRYRRPTSR